MTKGKPGSPVAVPAPTPPVLRQRLWDLAQQGHDAQTVAAALGRSTRTVRRPRAGFRAAGQATTPDYRRCGRPRPAGYPLWRQRTLTLRQAHAAWRAEPGPGG
jgi:transposase